MNEPTCLACRTDRYLKFTRRIPAHDETIPVGGWGETLSIPSHVNAEVEWFCRRCGKPDARSVEDGWKVPETATDGEIMKEFGQVYERPGLLRTSSGARVHKAF